MIYRKTGNLRALQLLLSHTKIESTVKYLGIEVEDAIEIVEKVDIKEMGQGACARHYKFRYQPMTLMGRVIEVQKNVDCELPQPIIQGSERKLTPVYEIVETEPPQPIKTTA